MNPIDKFAAALHRDDPALFRQTLAEHPEFKARINDPLGPFDSPAILAACSRGMLDALLEAGADLNARSRWWAGSFGLLDSASDELAQYAIERGARLDVHSAARLGMLDELETFLEEDPSAVHRRGGDGQTPLHFARNTKVAALLVRYGADMNARDVDHESTPVQWMLDKRQAVAGYLIELGAESDLFAAAALGDVELAQMHLDQNPGAIRMRVDAHSFPMRNPQAGGHIYQWTLGFHVSPDQVAAKFKHPEVLELLEQRSPAEVRLLNACWLGNSAEVERLLGETPNLAERLRETDRQQIAHAARNNDSEAVELMVRAGWPLEARGQHGGTALHWAAWHGNARAVAALLAAKAPKDLLDHEFHGNPMVWAKHGAENSWHKETGDYPAVIRLLEG